MAYPCGECERVVKGEALGKENGRVG